MADKWTTVPQPTQARAFLGSGSTSVTFPFNPDTVEWGYQENIISQDTLGGRVTQLLSVQIRQMTVNTRAGSRGELQRIMSKLKDIMGYHVNTLEPVHFKVPSRRWDFTVYLSALPSIGWDYASTSYPYSLVLLVEEDLQNIQTKKIADSILQGLVNGIGYNPDAHGGDAQHFYDIIKAVTTLPIVTDTLAQGVQAGGDAVAGVGNNIAGAWGGYSNGKIPYNAMRKIGNSRTSSCCPGKEEPALYLEPNAAADFERMQQAYGRDIKGSVATAYRAYDYQDCLYQAYLQHRCGIELASKPGNSPHGWGKGVDIDTGTAAHSWMVSNSEKYHWYWYGTGDDPHFSYGR